MQIDIQAMIKDNGIKSQNMLLKVGAVGIGIALSLCLTPLHKQEAAWFTFMGMLCLGMLLSPHDVHNLLEAVEWDTLLFFASLFVLVECVAELGLIRVLGNAIAQLIQSVPPDASGAMDARLAVGVIAILWVSSIGSAFLESLPYTATVCYLLLNMDTIPDLGISVRPLVFALSVGACVGGIGSIMGSSANLVGMGMSRRYLPKDAPPEHQINGSDFLKYGFPLLVVITTIGSGYLVVLFLCVDTGYSSGTLPKLFE
uniref:Pink-eyed dilution protein n=1 Tax=Callinectes arcuatus TaxID=257891 RepID=A0A7T1P509_CALAT|nr:pink-eyed dilution protein [Callinectes arcuatus]